MESDSHQELPHPSQALTDIEEPEQNIAEAQAKEKSKQSTEAVNRSYQSFTEKYQSFLQNQEFKLDSSLSVKIHQDVREFKELFSRIEDTEIQLSDTLEQKLHKIWAKPAQPLAGFRYYHRHALLVYQAEELQKLLDKFLARSQQSRIPLTDSEPDDQKIHETTALIPPSSLAPSSSFDVEPPSPVDSNNEPIIQQILNLLKCTFEGELMGPNRVILKKEKANAPGVDSNTDSKQERSSNAYAHDDLDELAHKINNKYKQQCNDIYQALDHSINRYLDVLQKNKSPDTPSDTRLKFNTFVTSTPCDIRYYWDPHTFPLIQLIDVVAHPPFGQADQRRAVESLKILKRELHLASEEAEVGKGEKEEWSQVFSLKRQERFFRKVHEILFNSELVQALNAEYKRIQGELVLDKKRKQLDEQNRENLEQEKKKIEQYLEAIVRRFDAAARTLCLPIKLKKKENGEIADYECAITKSMIPISDYEKRLRTRQAQFLIFNILLISLLAFGEMLPPVAGCIAAFDAWGLHDVGLSIVFWPIIGGLGCNAVLASGTLPDLLPDAETGELKFFRNKKGKQINDKKKFAAFGLLIFAIASGLCYGALSDDCAFGSKELGWFAFVTDGPILGFIFYTSIAEFFIKEQWQDFFLTAEKRRQIEGWYGLKKPFFYIATMINVFVITPVIFLSTYSLFNFSLRQEKMSWLNFLIGHDINIMGHHLGSTLELVAGINSCLMLIFSLKTIQTLINYFSTAKKEETQTANPLIKLGESAVLIALCCMVVLAVGNTLIGQDLLYYIDGNESLNWIGTYTTPALVTALILLSQTFNSFGPHAFYGKRLEEGRLWNNPFTLRAKEKGSAPQSETIQGPQQQQYEVSFA